MSYLLESYRRNAEAARIEAERATLPNVRARAAQAVELWSDMADKLEWVEEQGRERADAASRAKSEAR